MKLRKSKILCALLAGGVMLSSAGYVYADTVENTQNARPINNMMKMHHKGFKGNHKMNGMLKEVIDEKIEDGTITQEQVDEIRDAYFEKMNEQKEERMQERVNKLVEEEIITQEQADKIMETMKKCEEERRALHDKVKDMTPEERKEYLKEAKEEMTHPLQQLVDDGVLTQEQFDQIKELRMNREKMNPLDKIDQLLEKGAITEEKAEELKEKIENNQGRFEGKGNGKFMKKGFEKKGMRNFQ